METQSGEKIIRWLDSSIILSKSCSFREINQSLVKNDEFFDPDFSQFDRSQKIFEIANENAEKLKILSEEMKMTDLSDNKLHGLKDKVAKFMNLHSKTLLTVNGLKRERIEATITKFHENWGEII